MRELAAANLKLLKAVILIGCLLACATATDAAGYPVVKSMLIRDNPLSLSFEVTGKAPVKVIRISDTEVLVAMKDVSLAKGFTIQGKNSPAIEKVNLERLDGNVVAVVVTSKVPYGTIGSTFDKNKLEVSLSDRPSRVIKSRKRRREAEGRTRSQRCRRPLNPPKCRPPGPGMTL